MKKFTLLLFSIFVIASVKSQVTEFPWTENFDDLVPSEGIQLPENWVQLNENNDMVKWDVIANSTQPNAHSAPNAMHILSPFDGTANDWLITLAFEFTAGVDYQLSFWFQTAEILPGIESFSVYLGESQTSEAMTTELFSNSEVINTSYEEQIIDFSVETTGTYYIGFYSFSAANQSITFIDDVSISSNELSNENDIISFSFENQVGDAVIDTENHIVTAEITDGNELTSIAPTITVSEGATVIPSSGVTQDFSNPVDYTVTAEDGTEQIWTARISYHVDINNINNNFVKIYPNPVKDFIVIDFENYDNFNISIVNISGQVLKTFKQQNNGEKICIKDIKSGIYIINIESEKTYISKKIIVE